MRLRVFSKWYNCLSVFTVLTASASSNLIAQVILPESEIATTIDGIDTEFFVPSEAIGSRPRVIFDVNSVVNYSSNALSLSNLPGGLELPAKSGVFWNKGAAATLLYPVSPNLLLYARGSISHTNYFSNSNLDYFDISGSVGAVAALSRKTFFSLNVNCHSERDSDFRAFYNQCVPGAGFTTAIGNPYLKTGLEFGVRGALALGDRNRFARYREAAAHISFETGGKVRFQLRPEGSVRLFNNPSLFTLEDTARRDYHAGLRTSLFFRTPKLSVGIEADPRVNWSNIVQYRYWDLRAGPFIRLRF